MKTIDVTDDIFAALESRATGFGATPSTVIADLLTHDRNKTERNGFATEKRTEEHPLLRLIAAPEYRTGSGKERYFAVIRFLFRNHEKDLGSLLSYRRGTRINFATDAQTIENSGTDTKPQKLDGTPLYVMTNLNNPDKRAILQDVLSLYRYPSHVIREVTASIPDSGISRPKRLDLSGLI